MKPVNLFQNLNGRDINVHGTCCQKNFPYLNVRFTALEGRLILEENDAPVELYHELPESRLHEYETCKIQKNRMIVIRKVRLYGNKKKV